MSKADDTKELIARMRRGDSAGCKELIETYFQDPIDLSNQDLTGLVLSDVDFRGTKFNGADFSGSQLTGVWISYTEGARFDEVRFERFVGNSLKKCSFKSSTLSGGLTSCSECDLSGAELRGFSLQLRDSNFQGARLNGTFREIEAIGSNFKGCVFDETVVKSGHFLRCDLRDSKFVGAEFDSVGFADSELAGADLSGANLAMCRFRRCDLDGANFDGTKLDGAEFEDTDTSVAKHLRIGITGGSGENAAELSKQARRSKKLETSALLETDAGGSPKRYLVTVTCEHGGAFMSYEEQDAALGEKDWRRTTFDSIPEALDHIAVRFAGAKFDVADVKLSISKGSKKSTELVPTAYRAWCEAFGYGVLDDDALKERKSGERAAKASRRKRLLDQLCAEGGVAAWNEKVIEARSLGTFGKIDLSSQKLDGVNLVGFNLKGADFSNASLRKANFFEASLQGAKFAGADLAGANFHLANLNGADFSDASLLRTVFSTKLINANLSGADVEGAEIGASDLRGADLSGTELDEANWETFDLPLYDKRTVLPEGFTPGSRLEWRETGSA